MTNIAALPVVASTPNVAASQLDEHPDAEILALGAQLRSAIESTEKAYELCDRLRCNSEYREVQDICRYRCDGIDRAIASHLAWGAVFVANDRGFFSARDFERLQREPPQLGQAVAKRVMRLLAAHAKSDALEASLGICDADAAAERLYDAAGGIAEAIEGRQARTIAGLRVKVEAIRFCRTGDLADVEGDLATDMRLAQSIIMDLDAMAKIALQ